MEDVPYQNFWDVLSRRVAQSEQFEIHTRMPRLNYGSGVTASTASFTSTFSVAAPSWAGEQPISWSGILAPTTTIKFDNADDGNLPYKCCSICGANVPPRQSRCTECGGLVK